MNANLPNIWFMQTEGDWRGLVKALNHSDADIRRRAAVALRVIDAKESVDAIRKALEKEANPQVRVVLVAALDHLAPQDAPSESKETKRPQSRVERLIDHLTSGKPDTAVQAAQALGDLKDKIAVPPLIAVFRNRRQPASVRLAAAEALLEMNSAPAEVTLLAALRGEKWHLRRNGAAILGQLQADWAVEPLATALHDPNELVAKTARAALRRIGTPEARQALITAKKSIIDTSQLEESKFAARVEREKARDKKTGGKPANPPKRSGTVQQAVQNPKLPDTSKLRLPEEPKKKKPETGQLKAPIEEPNPPSGPKEAPMPEALIPPPSKPTPPAPLPLDAKLKPAPKPKAPTPQAEPKKLSQTERLKSRRRKSTTRRLVPPDDLPDDV